MPTVPVVSVAPAISGLVMSSPRSKLSSSMRQEHRFPTSGMVKVTRSRRSVDQDEHIVVEHGLTVCVQIWYDRAVDVDGDRFPARLPVGDGHRAALRGVPDDVAGIGQVAATAQHRVRPAHSDRPAGVGGQAGVGGVPVEPGRQVVLAIGVVVAALGAASSSPPRIIGTPRDSSSVASSARDRRARNTRIRGLRVGLSTPQFHDLLSLVPSWLPLAVGAVVLAVVGDQVTQGEPIVRGDEVDRRAWAAAGRTV